MTDDLGRLTEQLQQVTGPAARGGHLVHDAARGADHQVLDLLAASATSHSATATPATAASTSNAATSSAADELSLADRHLGSTRPDALSERLPV